MKITWAMLGILCCFMLGLVVAQRSAFANSDTNATVVTNAPSAASDTIAPEPVELAKKCSFNSDCPYGTCKSGQCGGCSFNSDCKGWGQCKSGQCGGCSFASDCKGFGSCSSGQCEKSPY